MGKNLLPQIQMYFTFKFVTGFKVRTILYGIKTNAQAPVYKHKTTVMCCPFILPNVFPINWKKASVVPIPKNNTP